MVVNPKKGAAVDAEPAVPIISLGCMEQKLREGKHAEDDLEPKTLIGFGRRQKWMIAEVVPSK